MFGIAQLPALRWVDLSSNDLRDTGELDRCGLLVDINLSHNKIADPHCIMRLAALPYLRTLNIAANSLAPSQAQAIRRHFAAARPHCRVIISDDAGGSDGPCGCVVS